MLARRIARSATQTVNTKRTFSTTSTQRSETYPNPESLDVEALLSTPTSSVSSLVPPTTRSTSENTESDTTITPKQLHHLLRLSTLPAPTSAAQESKMLETLAAQLHFVRSIQAVDTAGVEPLRSLRDETREGEEEAELGLADLKEALGKEEVKGRWHRRIRRVRGKGEEGDRKEDGWDVLGQAGRKTGRYFAVEAGKKKEA